MNRFRTRKIEQAEPVFKISEAFIQNSKLIMAKNRPKELRDYLTLDFSAETVLKNLPFILFLGLIGMMYIMNAHYSEKKLWQIQKYEDEIEELKWEYDAIKANLMYQTKQSEVAKAVESIGLKNSTSTPKRIIVKKGTEE